MKIKDIKIKESFLKTIPKEEKMQRCRENYIAYNRQDRYVVVNEKGELIDGYIMYLILKEFGQEEAEIKVSNKKRNKTQKYYDSWKISRRKKKNTKQKPVTYIYGVHTNSLDTKERVWRVPISWIGWGDDLDVGDFILVRTSYGLSKIKITKIEKSDTPPVDFKIKKVYKKLNEKEN